MSAPPRVIGLLQSEINKILRRFEFDSDITYILKSDYDELQAQLTLEAMAKVDAQFKCDELQAKLTETERLNKVALEAMKELEWCETEYDPAHGHSSSCPSCGGASKEGDLRHPNQEYGHYDDCPIANAIKEIEKGTA